MAHRDDYIDETFVYQTLRGGEFELEAWGEFRSPRGAARANQGWYTLAFESGFTNRWTFDGAAQGIAAENRGLRFGRLRTETRYRFGEEGSAPIDVAVSAEYELEAPAATGSSETEHTLTPRLVLSKDLLRDVNTTANLDLPISLSGGDVALAYALAARFPAETAIRVGAEFKEVPSENRAILFPQVWLALRHDLTVKVGAGIGLTTETDPFLGRLAFEAEF